MKNSFKSFKPQQGVTLLEVLITVIVMAVGLLGLAALQNLSAKFSLDSYARSQSSILANNMFDRIRANPSEIYQLNIDEIPAQASCVSDGTDTNFNCSPRDLVNADLYNWYTSALIVFPQVILQITEDDGDYSIRFSWEDRYENDEVENEAKQFIYRFSSR